MHGILAMNLEPQITVPCTRQAKIRIVVLTLIRQVAAHQPPNTCCARSEQKPMELNNTSY